MGRVNLENLTKAEIVRMMKWRCPLPGHSRHTGLEHPQCYLKLAGIEEHTGYFDIETTGLQADFGFIFSWCIKEMGKDEFKQAVFCWEDYEDKEPDRRIVTECVQALSNFDCVITYYGTRFDLPFLRTRALRCGLEFPFYGTIRHLDLYYVVRSKLHIHRNRLDAACELFDIYDKTRIKPNVWNRAFAADQEALCYIAEHNRIDTILLEKLHQKLEPYMKETRRSI